MTLQRMRTIPEDRIKLCTCKARLTVDVPIDFYLDELYRSISIEIAAKLRKFCKHRIVESGGDTVVTVEVEVIVPKPQPMTFKGGYARLQDITRAAARASLTPRSDSV